MHQRDPSITEPGALPPQLKFIDPGFPAWADVAHAYAGLKGTSDLPAPHLHREFEVGFVHTGRLTFMIANKHFDLTESDICIIASSEPHRAFYPAECVCSWMYFDIPRLLAHSAEEVSMTRVDTFQGPDFVNVFGGPEYPELSRLAREMALEFGLQGPYFRDALRSSLTGLLVRLHRLEKDGDAHFTGRANDVTAARGMIGRISPAIEYLHQNYGDRIDMEELAARVFMSPSNLRRVFDKCLGCSPHEYLTGHRVAAAQTRLQEGTGSVEEIALACGFTEPSSFRRAFKKITGQNPVSVRMAGRKERKGG